MSSGWCATCGTIPHQVGCAAAPPDTEGPSEPFDRAYTVAELTERVRDLRDRHGRHSNEGASFEDVAEWGSEADHILYALHNALISAARAGAEARQEEVISPLALKVMDLNAEVARLREANEKMEATLHDISCVVAGDVWWSWIPRAASDALAAARRQANDSP